MDDETTTTRRDFLRRATGACLAVAAVGAGALPTVTPPGAAIRNIVVRFNGREVGYAAAWTICTPSPLEHVELDAGVIADLAPTSYDVSFTASGRPRKDKNDG